MSNGNGLGDPSSEPATRVRIARLLVAAESAFNRIGTEEDDLFAPLGECLFWICALAEALSTKNEPLFQAFRWPRNRIDHGVLVAAPTTWNHGSELGMMVLGLSKLGTVSAYVWSERQKIPLSPSECRYPDQEKHYDEHLAGKALKETLRAALGLLASAAN